MIALDADEPLWHQSRHGCTQRPRYTGQCPEHRSCEAQRFCVPGHIQIQGTWAESET